LDANTKKIVSNYHINNDNNKLYDYLKDFDIFSKEFIFITYGDLEMDVPSYFKRWIDVRQRLNLS